MYNYELSLKENLKKEMEEEYEKGKSALSVCKTGFTYLSVYSPNMTVEEADNLITNIILEILTI